jgi:hypothetical protein
MTAQLNLVLAWVWIAVGVIYGFVLGLNFHRDDWLGGYAGLRRRLYRLAHIALFGLALINLAFYFTAQRLPHPSRSLDLASWGLALGAVTMPICCIVMAHRVQLRALFLIPVLSLLTGALLTVWEVVQL